MIDAYEIGIQLLLQDDVSAGLAVINRGLADVDRAIDATSAHLASLVQEGQRAAKAIAAALPGGTGRPVTSQPVSGEAGGASESRPQARGEASGEPAAQPATQRGGGGIPSPVPAAAPSVQTASPVSTERNDRRTEQPVTSAVSTSPAKAVFDRRSDGDREPAETGPRSLQQAVEREQVAPVPQVAAKIKSNADGAASALPTGPRADRPVGSQVAVTASIRGLAAGERGARPRDTAPSVTRPPPSAARERPAAPWAVTGMTGGGAGQAIGMGERAAAPASPVRESGGGGGGTVMLDGRLVGQWLSDHMAREASRPPGGTSFFDPRQTPAWTVSGAL